VEPFLGADVQKVQLDEVEAVSGDGGSAGAHVGPGAGVRAVQDVLPREDVGVHRVAVGVFGHGVAEGVGVPGMAASSSSGATAKGMK